MLQGFFPRFHVIHTSRKILGQVYIPIVNYMLMTLTLIVVGIFEKSSKLGQAYGEDTRLCFPRCVLGAVIGDPPMYGLLTLAPASWRDRTSICTCVAAGRNSN